KDKLLELLQNDLEEAMSGMVECGLILPLLDEARWNQGLRAILYLSGLLYLFLGIAIAADVFMCAIERITSQTRKVRISPSEAMAADDELIHVRRLLRREIMHMDRKSSDHRYVREDEARLEQGMQIVVGTPGQLRSRTHTTCG
ncbi:MAG: hypothetical protein GY854_08495, partial [Deltaproteobacteria bacterium]|nr:hypothetical protein [Deltaproteobacteria bacterium]